MEAAMSQLVRLMVAGDLPSPEILDPPPYVDADDNPFYPEPKCIVNHSAIASYYYQLGAEGLNWPHGTLIPYDAATILKDGWWWIYRGDGVSNVWIKGGYSGSSDTRNEPGFSCSAPEAAW